MKNKVTILFILFFTTTLLFAEDDLFYIGNPNNSEFVKNEIFTKMMINSDEIILLLVSPNTVPRLEIFINLTLENLVRRDIKTPFYTFASYPRLYALKDYAKSKTYLKNMILDTSMVLFNEYNLINVPPVLTRWSKDGELLNYVFIYGIDLNNDTIWDNFLIKKRKIAFNSESKDLKSGYTKENFKLLKNLVKQKEIIIYEDKDIHYGTLEGAVEDNSGKYLVATDYMFGNTLVFDLKTRKEISKLSLNYEQRKIFSKELDDSLFIRGERRGIAATLFFKPFFDQDNNLYITATLPRVELQIIGKDSSIYYHNVPCLIEYTLKSQNIKFKRIIELKDNQYNGKLATKHIFAKEYNLLKNEITIPTSKGYPVSGFHKENRPDDENPITNVFYSDSPLFFTYDILSGEKTGVIGELNQINQKIGSGYYFANPMITYNKKNYFISQHLVSYIQVSDGSKLELKSYFNKNLIKDVLNRVLDTIPNTTDLDRFYQTSNAAISSINASDSILSVIWIIKEKGKQIKNSGIKLLQKYSLEDKSLIGEYIIPTTDNDFNLVNTYHNQKQNILICIYQNAINTKIIYYEI